jgi:hypothetical protein
MTPNFSNKNDLTIALCRLVICQYQIPTPIIADKILTPKILYIFDYLLKLKFTVFNERFKT